MVKGALSVLAEGQVVRLDLGPDSDPIRCHMLGFGGPNVVLAPLAPPSASTRAALEPGRDCYLVSESGGPLQALRGTLHDATHSDAFVIRLTDYADLGQRRQFSRAPLVLPITLRPLDGGTAWATFTRDVSAGGVRVARQRVRPEGTFELAITLPDRERQLTAAARVVRAADEDVSLSFVRIDPADRGLLAQVTLAYYRELMRT